MLLRDELRKMADEASNKRAKEEEERLAKEKLEAKLLSAKSQISAEVAFIVAESLSSKAKEEARKGKYAMIVKDLKERIEREFIFHRSVYPEYEKLQSWSPDPLIVKKSIIKSLRKESLIVEETDLMILKIEW